jgi:hypothetical protein
MSHAGPLAHLSNLANLKATIEGPITAELNGAVNITIKVEATSDLIKTVEAARSVSSKGNILKLNTGSSMPEAAPGARQK